jgi:hypothetical protein
MESLGDGEDCGAPLLTVGRPIAMTIFLPLRLTVMVLVVSDVEVEVEETGAELAMSVPVANRVQAKAADADSRGDAQHQPEQAGTPDHGSM